MFDALEKQALPLSRSLSVFLSLALVCSVSAVLYSFGTSRAEGLVK